MRLPSGQQANIATDDTDPGFIPDICYVDDYLIIVNKPAKLCSVPGKGEYLINNMYCHVQHLYPDAQIVHRLDMATSGLLVMARGKVMLARLSVLFQQRLVTKRYIALVDGWPDEPTGVIDLPITIDWPNRPRQKVDFKQGKPAVTRFQVLVYEANGSARLELEPVTGRTHQLRLHLAASGYAILGDNLYAGAAAMAKASRLMLHAARLAFKHPVTGHHMVFNAEIPF